ncbi:MAG: NADP-dependent isocitrate dehydrogenase [Planctomycetota bacterium]
MNLTLPISNPHLPALNATEPSNLTEVAIARGDGIGPEIMDAVLAVLQAAEAPIRPRPIDMGEHVYLSGNKSGITDEAWRLLRQTGVLLKAPITTPQGGGYKSLNVTLRKTLGLFANIRPCVAYHPYAPTRHPGMDVVVVRENEEDTYGGIEHRQTHEVTQCLKLISWPGSLRLCRYAMAYARARGREQVTCFVKDNIMKQTDGLFRAAFEQAASEYPDIETQTMIIDIGTAKLAARPEMFDVIVAPNLYGDIISDVAAEVAGSVGLVGTSNIGPGSAMFEAIHGSAPDIAGLGIANPSGLLLSAVQMLEHLGQHDHAKQVHNAWLCTIEDGIHTADIYRPKTSQKKLGTMAFAEAVIDRLGQEPTTLAAIDYDPAPIAVPPVPKPKKVDKQLVGVDVFLHWDQAKRDPDVLANDLMAITNPGFVLKMLTNRGTKVWPQGLPETFCTDHWRCRFLPSNGSGPMGPRRIVKLLGALAEAGLDVVKTENLYRFDGKPGYSMGQGES